MSPTAAANPGSPLRVGYAVAWNRDPRTTWSHTPWSLRQALLRHAALNLTDIHLSMPSWRKLALKAWHITRYQGRWMSGWGHSPVAYRDHHASLLRSVANADLDVLLEIGDWGDAPLPSFVYQDYSYLHLEHDHARNGYWTPQYDYHSERMLRKRIDIQRRTIGTHRGIMTMSAWDARFMAASGLIDPDRIHVVPPGMNVDPMPLDPADADIDPSKEFRVVFVGRDPWRFIKPKAGDMVVEAVRKLHNGGRRIRLVIVGPAWLPMPDPLPSWLTLVPDASFDQVREELRQADVFCMPSRFEAFGMAFIEALGAGIPVIGRNAYAMPEFIKHGDNGYMLSEDGTIDELASLIDATLGNSAMRARVIAQAPAIAEYYTWDRAANDMYRIMRKAVDA